MSLSKKVLTAFLVVIVVFFFELGREEFFFLRSAAYKMETSAQQLKRNMTKEQVIQLLGQPPIKAPAGALDSAEFSFPFEWWLWREPPYQRWLWNMLGAQRRRDPLEISAFFTDKGLEDVMIENVDYRP